MLDYKKLKMCFKPFEGCTILGKGTTCPLSPAESRALRSFKNVQYYEKCYQRIILKGRIFCTVAYCQNFQNNDSCALMNNGDVVFIKHILVLPSKEIVILAEKQRVTKRPILGNNHTKLNHVLKVEHTDVTICSPVNNISRPCALMLSPKNDILFSPIPHGWSVE